MNIPRSPTDSNFTYMLKGFFCASSAAMVSEVATIPFDTAKVRLQLQGKVKKG